MIKTDVLVIGTGIAGLSAALRLSEEANVLLVSKSSINLTNSRMAQGGLAAVGSDEDSFKQHIEDTLKAGVYLNKPEVIRKVVEEGPNVIKDLIHWGVEFDKKENLQDFHLGLEGGHSQRRIYHIHDRSGEAIHQALIKKIKGNPKIKILEKHCAIDLITTRKLKLPPSPTQECYGTYLLDIEKDQVVAVAAKKTILATGGAGKIYLYTSNWEGATGDGIAMAYRAGCRVANMEFMQFHPTCLYHPHVRNFLISEALRGEGAKLVNKKGVEFAKNKHPNGALAPRDIVARIIDEEIKRSGEDCVFLDISHKNSAWIKEHFPKIYKTCLDLGIDITKQAIPVVPAAHYLCGGVWTNLDGSCDIDGLYCIGEMACNGLHGANRLASNSLLECLVQSKFASKSILSELKTYDIKLPFIDPWQNPSKMDSDELSVINHMWDEIRNIMWNYVGIVRSNKRLNRAMQRLQYINSEVYEYYWDMKVHRDILELRNLALIAKLSIISAIKRKESRGCHYNIDYPEQESELVRPTLLNPNYR